MAGIVGDDHKLLAQLVDHELTQVRNKISETSDSTIRIETKVDMLIDLHREDSQRLDDHLESHASGAASNPVPAAEPESAVSWWRNPKVLRALAVVIGTLAALAMILGREIDSEIVSHILHGVTP